ncbi:nucleotidyltransferase family protein [Terrimonas ferruginea]|uniref:nucleotidyltransferase family protein n=1 Tax=Terrimonas ferruginea TaxID=249 RepID=UPI00048C66FF|nr:nucleotidyltransferase family protein [Terrimonas ferruginea]
MKAMIFSAGLGTRFRPWTDKHPKALALVNGQSLLERNIRYLQQQGIEDVIVNVHHFPGQIREAINKNNGWGSRVAISDESGEVLETGGGLVKARGLLTQGEDFLTINVDILTSLDVRAMLTAHQQKNALVTLAVTGRSTSRCFVFDKNDRLTAWRNVSTGQERRVREGEGEVNKAYSGISIFRYEFFDLVSQQGKFSLVDAYLELAKDHTLTGFDHTGDKWVDVGRPESVTVAEEMFR